MAACGGSGGSSTGASSGTSGTTSQVGTAITTPPPTGELDQLKWGLFYEPGPLDWIYDFNYEENTVVANITESLMRLTPQFGDRALPRGVVHRQDALTNVYRSARE